MPHQLQTNTNEAVMTNLCLYSVLSDAVFYANLTQNN